MAGNPAIEYLNKSFFISKSKDTTSKNSLMKMNNMRRRNIDIKTITISIVLFIFAVWLVFNFFIGPHLYLTYLNNESFSSWYYFISIVEFLPLILICCLAFVVVRKVTHACLISFSIILFFTLISYCWRSNDIYFPSVYYRVQNPYNDKKFSKMLWRLNYSFDDGFNVRGLMISDLIQNYLKIGMTRKEVENILGMPTFVKDSSFCYDVGVFSNILDNDYLRILFNAQGQVIAFQLMQG